MENTYNIDSSLIRIDFETMDTIMKSPVANSESLIEGLIRYDYPNVVMIGAQPKLGKTHFTLDMCTEIARGGNFLGFKCKKGKTLYINLDSSKDEIKRRVQNIGFQKHLTDDEMKNFAQITLRCMPISDIADALIRDVKDAGFSLVVIDALFDCYFGPNFESYDENNVGDATKFMNQVKRISEALKCPVALVHHFRKSSEGYSLDPLDAFRGSGALTAAADTLIALSNTHINTNTRKNIQDITGETECFLKGVLVTVRERSFEDPEPFKCWLQDGIYHRDTGEFVKGASGRPRAVDSDKEAFEEAFNSLEVNGRAKVSKMAEALGISIVTVKARADEYGYIRPDKGYISKTGA